MAQNNDDLSTAKEIHLLRSALQNTQQELARLETQNNKLRIELNKTQELLRECQQQMQILRSVAFPFLKSARHLKARIKC